MRPKASEVAYGKWPSILSALGVDKAFLRDVHGPCPMCGGRDRFRFDDKEGRGTWFCSHCGSGDGFRLLMQHNGWTFFEAARQVESIAGNYDPEPEKKDDSAAKVAAVKRIWEESRKIERGDPAWLYLNRRTGIDIAPSCLRFHPSLIWQEDGQRHRFPALVCAFVGSDGIGSGIQRIYLTEDGRKAQVKPSKKTLAAKPLQGGSVRLFRADQYLGIAEGVETAIASSIRFGVPVWSALSANLLEQWSPPSGVSGVTVFGDNDESFTGQAAAFNLAKRLRKSGLAVTVRIPDKTGKDWADEDCC